MSAKHCLVFILYMYVIIQCTWYIDIFTTYERRSWLAWPTPTWCGGRECQAPRPSGATLSEVLGNRVSPRGREGERERDRQRQRELTYIYKYLFYITIRYGNNLIQFWMNLLFYKTINNLFFNFVQVDPNSVGEPPGSCAGRWRSRCRRGGGSRKPRPILCLHQEWQYILHFIIHLFVLVNKLKNSVHIFWIWPKNEACFK